MPTIETDWAGIHEAIQAWFETLSSPLANTHVYWRDDGLPQYAPGIDANILLHLASIEERGIKTYRYESTGDPGAKFSVPKVTRLLRVVLDVSVQSGWQTPSSLALAIMLQLRTRAALSELHTDLEDYPIAYSNAGPVISVPFESDGYQLSQATSEWILFLHDVYQNSDVSVETIENVYGVGTPPDDVIVDPALDDDDNLLP